MNSLYEADIIDIYEEGVTVKPIEQQISVIFSASIGESTRDFFDDISVLFADDFESIAYLAVTLDGYKTPIFEYTSVSTIDMLNNISKAIGAGQAEFALTLIENFSNSFIGADIPELNKLHDIAKVMIV